MAGRNDRVTADALEAMANVMAKASEALKTNQNRGKPYANPCTKGNQKDATKNVISGGCFVSYNM